MAVKQKRKASIHSKRARKSVPQDVPGAASDPTVMEFALEDEHGLIPRVRGQLVSEGIRKVEISLEEMTLFLVQPLLRKLVDEKKAAPQFLSMQITMVYLIRRGIEDPHVLATYALYQQMARIAQGNQLFFGCSPGGYVAFEQAVLKNMHEAFPTLKTENLIADVVQLAVACENGTVEITRPDYNYIFKVL